MGKISPACKAAAKKKFEVWPSAYASGWGVRCTKAGGPGKMGKSIKEKIMAKEKLEWKDSDAPDAKGKFKDLWPVMPYA